MLGGTTVTLVRLFRKPLLLTNCQVSVQTKRSKNGVDGVLFRIDGEVVIKYDVSQNYEVQDKMLKVKLEEEYHPKKYSNHQVGIDNIAESYVSTKILEKGATSDNVIDGWKQYDTIIPLDKTIKFLIARDINLLKLGNYLLKSGMNYGAVTPSWDVCLSLALYFKLCEKIENFEEKLHEATDIGDQIRGNLRKLDIDIREGNYFSAYFNHLLLSLHSLNDELELAYNIWKHGYNDIRFGRRGEPDYFINDVAIEQKSRFPELEYILEKKASSTFQYAEALKELILEIKQSRKALKKADVFFYNVSRLRQALKFCVVTELEKKYMFSDFGIVMKNIFILLERGKVVIPYAKLYSVNPKITSFPIPENIVNAIEKQKSEPYITWLGKTS